MSITTPNMQLTKPTVSVTEGTLWAEQINSSLSLVDSHDHSSGKGVKITPAGMNINSNLSFGSNAAESLSYLHFTQSTTPTTNDVVFVSTNGSLKWKTVNGEYTILDATGSAASVGGFTGDYSSTDAQANYSDTTKAYSFLQDTGITAFVNSGAISIFENVLSSNSVTIAPVSSLAASYTLTLPSALPSGDGLLLSDSSGGLSFVENGLEDLTSAEVDQLENIDSTTISATQWGYLGELDQALKTTDAVTFATVNTGQGANELYAMDQDVQTTDDVEFNSVQVTSGSAASPSNSFMTDTDTGSFNAATNVLGFSAGGTHIASINIAGISPATNNTYNLGAVGASYARIFAGSGSVSSPSMTFGGDSDTGAYNGATNTFDIAAAGVNTVTVTSNSFRTNVSNNSYFFFGTTTTTNDILSIYSNVGGAFTQKWRVEADGDTISATGSYTSDERAKKDIEDIHYGLKELMKLEPKSFRWNHETDKDEKSFCISTAQKVESIMPEMVRDDGITMDGQEVPEDLKNDTRERYKSVYEKEIAAVMVKAIQEQQEIIENLKKRIEVLESK